jgi:hypothetical protein
MSLKSLHLFFVLAGVLACSAYGMWNLVVFLRDGGVPAVVMALLPLSGGLALVLHGVFFFKSAEDEPWL